jgi:hypothetical protein
MVSLGLDQVRTTRRGNDIARAAEQVVRVYGQASYWNARVGVLARITGGQHLDVDTLAMQVASSLTHHILATAAKIRWKPLMHQQNFHWIQAQAAVIKPTFVIFKGRGYNRVTWGTEVV